VPKHLIEEIESGRPYVPSEASTVRLAEALRASVGLMLREREQLFERWHRCGDSSLRRRRCAVWYSPDVLEGIRSQKFAKPRLNRYGRPGIGLGLGCHNGSASACNTKYTKLPALGFHAILSDDAREVRFERLLAR
jgi:hypothetical protein